jgi:hypothetical protein
LGLGHGSHHLREVLRVAFPLEGSAFRLAGQPAGRPASFPPLKLAFFCGCGTIQHG